MLAVFLRRLGSVERSGRVGDVGGSLPSVLPWQQRASFVDVSIRWVRDRGLDHAVEKEKHLPPLHALKELLLSGEPPPLSLPLRSISERREELGLPFRPISFIRRYPNAFVEDHPLAPSSPPSSSSSPNSSTSSAPAADPSQFQPRIRATEELVGIHKEEILANESCRADVADRLLRLLMLTRKRGLPRDVVDRLCWDFGLPSDYPRSLVPDFPDYFRISEERFLELVFWNKDLAVSAMEQSAHKGFQCGMPLVFPVQFSNEFKLDKKVKKWMDEWQKLPYISPYTDCSRLDPCSAQGEKWAVGVLHELLHLLVSKKTNRENLVLLSTHVGINRSFSKKLLVNYPGIFYTSSKNGTHTVVLRDAYRRGALVKGHRLMEIRYQYIHLMNKIPEEDATNSRNSKKKARKDAARATLGEDDDEEFEEEETELEEEETEGEWDESSDYENEESCDEDFTEVVDDEKISAVGQNSLETNDSGDIPLTSPTASLKTTKAFQVKKTKPRVTSVNISRKKKKDSTRYPDKGNQVRFNKIISQLTTIYPIEKKSSNSRSTSKLRDSTGVPKTDNKPSLNEITSQLKTRKETFQGPNKKNSFQTWVTRLP